MRYINFRVLVKVSLTLYLAALNIGCTGPAQQSAGRPPVQASELVPREQKNIVHLSAGDTVLVSVETQLSPEPISGQISKDGTLGIWGAQRVQVAGLTPDEAASRIRFALVTNYIGVVFHKVGVIRIQPTD